MTPSRPPPFFIADNLGLDFLNSIAVPVDAKVEWLASGEDLLAWLELAGLVPGDVLDTFRRKTAPRELDAIAAQARTLRDWFKKFVYKRMGRPLEASALRRLELLNQLLARDEEFGQIVVAGGVHGDRARASGFIWHTQRRWRSPESLLLPIARSLADLVCTEDFTDIKACRGPACTLLFVDRTRVRGRKWCSMAVCGNRAKQAAHRERLQKTRQRRRWRQ
jgi:predicted RNA-binding Zn ribbon-like protein